MKRIFGVLVMMATLAAAQSPPSMQSRVAGRFVAWNYGLWTLPVYTAPAGTGSQTFSLNNATVVLADGRQFMPFNTNSPILFGTEKVTPTAVGSGCILGGIPIGGCVITATFSNAHTTADVIRPATFGLQEALNDASASSGGAVVIDSAWAGIGGTTTIKNAVTIPSSTAIEDVRTGTSSGSGTVTSVTGTANQIDVAAGTTTPVLSLDPALILPTGTTAKVINGVSYSSNYTGTTLDVRYNACVTDAETLANGNTTGICDATGEGTQTYVAELEAGDGVHPVTILYPSNAVWTANISGGTSCALKQWALSSNIGTNTPATIDFSINGGGSGLAYVHCLGTGAQKYFYMKGIAFTNYVGPTANSTTAKIANTWDTSAWENMTYITNQDSKTLVTDGLCCGTYFLGLHVDGDLIAGNIPWTIASSSGNAVNGFACYACSIGHPGSGNPNINLTDTEGTHSATVDFYNLYTETSSTNGTQAIIQTDSLKRFGLHGWTINPRVASPTFHGISNSNAYHTLLDVDGVSFVNSGVGSWTYPIANGVIDSNTGITQATDAFGNIANYGGGPAYFNSLTTSSGTVPASSGTPVAGRPATYNAPGVLTGTTGYVNAVAAGADNTDGGTLSAAANATLINSLITSLSATCGTIYLPAGLYKINALTLNTCVSFLGDSAGLTSPSNVAPDLHMAVGNGTWFDCNAQTNCATGSALREFNMDHIGFYNWTGQAILIGGSDVDGASFGNWNDVNFIGGNTVNTSDTAVQISNFQHQSWNGVRAYNVNTCWNFINQSHYFSGGNSNFGSLYCYTYPKSAANSNAAKPGLWLQVLNPASGTALALNGMNFTVPQVNSYSGDGTGINVIIQGLASPATNVISTTMVGMDIEGTFVNGVYIQQASDTYLVLTSLTQSTGGAVTFNLDTTAIDNHIISLSGNSTYASSGAANSIGGWWANRTGNNMAGVFGDGVLNRVGANLNGPLSSTYPSSATVSSALFQGTQVVTGTPLPFFYINGTGGSPAWSANGDLFGLNGGTGCTNIVRGLVASSQKFAISCAGLANFAGGAQGTVFEGTGSASNGSYTPGGGSGTTANIITRNIADAIPTLQVTDTNASATGSALQITNSGSGLGLATPSIGQNSASNFAGTCAMVASTSCTITLAHTYTTPVCITTQQSATLTGGAVGCTVSGVTVTITAATSNSETWGALVFGNPN